MEKSKQRRKKIKLRTPGGRLVVQFKKKKPNYVQCGSCGKKIVRARLPVSRLAKFSKTEKRPGRPFPELCSRCMREFFKTRIRG